MLVGVSMRVEKSQHGELRDAIAQSWVPLLEGLGCSVVLIPNLMSDPVKFAKIVGIKAVLLTGGEGLALTNKIKSRRQLTEEKLLSYACEESIPVLGVCRGFQLINKYFGGEVSSELSLKIPEERHLARDHDVYDVKSGRRMIVNSYHDDGVTMDQLADELDCLMVTQRGVVEAFKHSHLNIQGVQWHPERATKLSAFDQSILDIWLNKT